MRKIRIPEMITPLVQRFETAREKYFTAAAKLGEKHPAVKKLSKEIGKLRDILLNEKGG